MSDPLAPPGKQPKRGGLRKLALALALIALVLGAAGAFLYVRFVRPPARAHLHLPRGTAVGVRFDAVELISWRPVRERLLPVLREAKSETDAAGASLFTRLAEVSGVRLPEHVREVVVGSVDGSQWMMAIGGTLEPGRFVDGLETVLRERGTTGFVREGDVLVHSASGLAVGQAEDGTLVLGTTKSLVLAALPEHEPEEYLSSLLRDSHVPVTFVLNAAATKGATAQLPAAFDGLSALSQIEQMDGLFRLGDTPSVELELRPRGVSAVDLARSLETQVGVVKLALFLLPSDLGGAKRALQDAKLEAAGDRVKVHAPWPYQALDDGVAALADGLRVSLALTRATK